METYIIAKTKVMWSQEHCGFTVNDKGIMRRRGSHCVTSLSIHCLALHRLMHLIAYLSLSHSMHKHSSFP